MSRRRRTGAASAVAMVGLVALMGACGTQSGQLDREQEALIDRTAGSAMEAMGGSDQFVAFEYARTTSSCRADEGVAPGLGEDEGWYARKAYDLAARDQPYDYPAMIQAAHDHYRELGWDVQLYRDGDLGLALLATQDDVGVRVITPPTQLTVSTGPCGPALSGPDDDWEPIASVDDAG